MFQKLLFVTHVTDDMSCALAYHGNQRSHHLIKNSQEAVKKLRKKIDGAKRSKAQKIEKSS